jgi:hypothetical protein
MKTKIISSVKSHASKMQICLPKRQCRQVSLTFIFLLLSFIFLSVSEGSAQAPQGFNYQAVARDVSGNELVNTDMSVKIGILSGSSADSLVWEEIHSVTTNDYGLFIRDKLVVRIALH